MCIVELIDNNFLTRMLCLVTVFDEFLKLNRDVELKLLEHCLMEREVIFGFDIDFHKVDGKIAITKGIEQGQNIIGTVDRGVILILIKNLWSVYDTLIFTQQLILLEINIQAILDGAPKRNSLCILIISE